MTAYLRAGDKITLAVPDLHPGNTIAEDTKLWKMVYGALDVEVHHLVVHHGLTHPVVVAVFRDPPGEGGDDEDPS